MVPWLHAKLEIVGVSPRKRTDGLETIERVITFAREELAAAGPVKFNVLRVIEKSGVARSSVYHHFGGRDGLIAAVHLRDVVSDVQIINRFIREKVESSVEFGEIADFIRFYLGAESGDNGAFRRARRLSTLAAAESSPALMAILRDNQIAAAEYLAETVRIAVSRGVISPSVSERGVAHFLLSLLFGRVMVDLTGDPSDDDAWLDAAMAAIRGVVSPGTPGGGGESAESRQQDG